jgi:SAM-dependent methyltransferase
MSEEVRSNTLPTPAEEDPPAAQPPEGSVVVAEQFPSAETSAGPVFLSEPPTLPRLRVEAELHGSDEALRAVEGEVDSARTLLPQLSTELSPPRHSERPPHPSQRPAESPEAAPIELRNGGNGSARTLPPSVTLSDETEAEALPRRSLSEPVPLIVQRSTATPGPRTSTLPPGLVEPKRIIQVLGSNVPVLDSAWEEEIEDLDASEAYEVSETPAPQGGSPDSEPELELDLVVDDTASLADAEALAGADEPAIEVENAEALAADTEAALDEAAPGEAAEAREASPGGDETGEARPAEPPARPRAKAPPPNKRKRPPPPSTRQTEKAQIETAPAARKWWEEMFSEEFLRAIPILSPRQLEREVNFIDESLSVAPGGRILDLACGAGQHTVELAARGYDLVGFDLSQSQLDWAAGLAQERGQRLQFTHGDMRELGYQDAFDAVYCWNTSFGFFEEEKNTDVAMRIFKSLRPGGRFLLDVVNRDFVVSQQPGQTWFEGDGCVCIDDVTIDFITSRMRVKRTLMLTNGKNRECNYSVRIYGLHELGKVLHDVGFKVLKVSGRPEMPGVFFGVTSPRIIILAVKP